MAAVHLVLLVATYTAAWRGPGSASSSGKAASPAPQTSTRTSFSTRPKSTTRASSPLRKRAKPRDSCDAVQTPVQPSAAKRCRFAGWFAPSRGHVRVPANGRFAPDDQLQIGDGTTARRRRRSGTIRALLSGRDARGNDQLRSVLVTRNRLVLFGVGAVAVAGGRQAAEAAATDLRRGSRFACAANRGGRNDSRGVREPCPTSAMRRTK